MSFIVPSGAAGAAGAAAQRALASAPGLNRDKPAVGGLVAEDGTTAISAADLPGLEVSLDDGATWQTVEAAGLTVSFEDRDTLLVEGLPDDGTVPRYRYHGDPLAEPFYRGNAAPDNDAIRELWWTWPVDDSAAAPGVPVWPVYDPIIAEAA